MGLQVPSMKPEQLYYGCLIYIPNNFASNSCFKIANLYWFFSFLCVPFFYCMKRFCFFLPDIPFVEKCIVSRQPMIENITWFSRSISVEWTTNCLHASGMPLVHISLAQSCELYPSVKWLHLLHEICRNNLQSYLLVFPYVQSYATFSHKIKTTCLIICRTLCVTPLGHLLHKTSEGVQH